MKKFRFIILAFGIIGFCFSTQAQVKDNIIWASVKLQKNVGEKTSFALAPIVRLNEDISNYQNSSIDISVKQKLAKGWSVQLLARTWFMPDAPDRQFLWFDIAYSKSWKKMKLGSSLRWHYAMDIKEREDADFIRWKTSFMYTGFGKIKPLFNIEPWWRINGANEFQRIRYEIGASFQLSKSMDFVAFYRKEDSMNLDPGFRFNMYVVTLVYKL